LRDSCPAAELLAPGAGVRDRSAAGALLVANRPFGFVALLGLIALAGMIMRLARAPDNNRVGAH
jgi:hypothetical protein